MHEAVREMTFEEEYEILQRESERVFANEKECYEPPLANCVLRRALRCIKKLQENQPKTDWIPCEERLPEKNKVVLCWVVSTTIASGETYIVGSCDNGFWFLQSEAIGTHSFPVKDYKVVAWQPLPQPYKKED